METFPIAWLSSLLAILVLFFFSFLLLFRQSRVELVRSTMNRAHQEWTNPLRDHVLEFKYSSITAQLKGFWNHNSKKIGNKFCCEWFTDELLYLINQPFKSNAITTLWVINSWLRTNTSACAFNGFDKLVTWLSYTVIYWVQEKIQIKWNKRNKTNPKIECTRAVNGVKAKNHQNRKMSVFQFPA